MEGAIALVRLFRGKRVLVLGDAMLDSYYQGTATRLSAEAPMPVVRGQKRVHVPGGAANVASNVRALGASVALVSVCGLDETGRLLKEALAARHVSPAYLIEDGERRTIQKLRVVADGHFVARFDEGDTAELGPVAEERLLRQLSTCYEWAEALIISDYLGGVVTPRVVAEIERLTRAAPKVVLADSKNLRQLRQCNLSVITPNHLEAQQALDLRLNAAQMQDGRHADAVGFELLEQMQTRWAIVTMGPDGSILFERDRAPYHIRPRPVNNPQVVGAGDTFTSALALALIVGGSIREACELAADAAAIAVSKPGTTAVSQQELLQRLSIPAGVTNPKDLATLVCGYREQGKRIVLTNGCFDILHSGHISYLEEAKRQGDVLIVGVNSDASVRKLKGPSRPINGQYDRLAVVAALQSVDHAVLFDEDTPERLIREIRPDVHVKGGDYHIDDLPEAGAVREVGGEVVIVPLVEGKSSTSIIEKIAGLKERAAGAE